MNVSLTPELERFVKKELEGGDYQTASEVIRAGLRLLKENRDALPRVPSTLDELEGELLESIERIEEGEGVNGEEAFKRIRARLTKLSRG